MEDRLQKFARVVETGSITKAARALRISQPALSTTLHKLQRELKTELVKHTGRTIEITDAGRAVYGAASAIRGRLQDLSQELAQLRQQKPHICIGMIDSLAELLAIKGDLLQQLETTASVSLVVNNSGYLARAVEQGELDIALVAWQPRVAASLRATAIGSEPLVLVTQREGLAGVQAQIGQGVVPNFLAYNPTSNTFQLIGQHFARRGLRAEAVFYSTSPEVIMQLALAGRGVAVLPFQMVRGHLRAGGALALAARDVVERPIVALQQKTRVQPPFMDFCLGQARQSLAQLSAAANSHT